MKVEDLLTFPLESDDWLVTLLIGSLLAFTSFLLVPAIALAGYFVETMRGGLVDDPEPPAFDDWGELLKDGLFATIILLVYQVVPMVVFGVLTVFSGGLIATGSDAGAGLGLLGIFASIGLYAVLSVAFVYVGTAGVVNYAREGTLAAGFDTGTLRTVVTSTDWLYAFGLYVLLLVLANVGSTLVITAPFLSFYALWVSSRAWGEAFASATGTEHVVDDQTAAAV
jgi:hypothetical protein